MYMLRGGWGDGTVVTDSEGHILFPTVPML